MKKWRLITSSILLCLLFIKLSESFAKNASTMDDPCELCPELNYYKKFNTPLGATENWTESFGPPPQANGMDTYFEYTNVVTTGSSKFNLVTNCSGIIQEKTDPSCTISATYTATSTASDIAYVTFNIFQKYVGNNVLVTATKIKMKISGRGYSYISKEPVKPVCASIINPETRSLAEEIPVVGCEFNLHYTTENSIGFTGLTPKANRISYFNPEGWSVTSHHFYKDGILYRGNGTSEALNSTVSGSNTYVVSSDGADIYVFDSTGKHLYTKTSLTGASKYSFSYDSNNRLVSIVDSYGNTSTFNRSVSGVLTSIDSSYGVSTNIGTNSIGMISSVQNPKGETYYLTYKSGTELLETFQKPGGQTSTFTYDSNGKLAKDLGHGGNFWDLVSTNAQKNRISSARGIYTDYETLYDIDNGSISRTVTTPTLLKTYSQDIDGNTTESSEGVTQVTSYSDDERFGSTLKRPSSNVVTYSSTSSTETLTKSVVWPSGVTADWFNYSTITTGSTINSQTVTSVFDAATKTSTTTTPEGATSSVTVNSNEMVVSSQTGSDTAWSYSYDTRGRISQIIQGTNNGLTYAYNSSGYLQSITNLRGEVVSYVYDLAGRVTQVTLPDSRIITYSYDANGNLTSVTPPSKPLHGMSFNAMELISTYSPPALSGLTTKDTTYTYNLDKQLTQITRPTGDTVGFTYSSTTGLLTTTTIAAGNFSYTYLSKNRISQANSPDDYYNSLSWYGTKLLGDAQWKTSTNFLYGKASYTYDSQHRISSRTFRGNSATNTFTRNYTYNNDSQITQAGSLSLTYTYPSGRLNTTSIDKISDSRTYDSYGNIQSYTAVYTPTSGSPQTLYSYTLSRDSMGRISGKSETVLGVTDAYTYSYDTAGRLTTVLKNGSAYSSYVYDSNGNRTSGTTAGTAFTATYDDQDRILTYNSRTYSYNANGDLTHIQWSPTVDSSYVYDALGDLRQATLSTGNVLNYSYDGLNRRIRKMDGTTLKYHYIFEGDGRIAGHVNINGVIQREYIYGSDAQVPDYVIASGVSYRLISDHLGSVRLVVKTDDGTVTQRLDYNDLGEAVNDTNAGFQAFGFAGGVYDGQTKFVKFGARDYDPRAAGRWTTKDPIGFKGGDTNFYGYVLNDPINLLDSSGLIFTFANKKAEFLFNQTYNASTGPARELLDKIRKDTSSDVRINVMCDADLQRKAQEKGVKIEVSGLTSGHARQTISVDISKLSQHPRLLMHEIGHASQLLNGEGAASQLSESYPNFLENFIKSP